MITRNKEALPFWDCECDRCSYYDEIEADDFPGAIRAIRREGWAIKSTNGRDWEHVCPVCKEKEDKEPVSVVTHAGYGQYK